MVSLPMDNYEDLKVSQRGFVRSPPTLYHRMVPDSRCSLSLVVVVIAA